jgi:ubiquinone/menaquinone biosynthesis C-methylase UbiE
MDNANKAVITAAEIPKQEAVVHEGSEPFVVTKCSGGALSHANVVFWFIFEWTIAQLLARHIERKSIRIVQDHLRSQPEGLVHDDAIRSGELLRTLAKSRWNFGKQRIPELFRIQTLGFNATSKLLQHFCEHVQNSPSLDDVYNATGVFFWNSKRIWPVWAKPDFFARFYLSCPNAQAVRNRYLVVKELYQKHCAGETLSIACGSAQPLIHAASDLKAQGKVVKLVLTDPSAEALNLARRRAEDAGVADQLEMVAVPFTRLTETFDGRKFDSIEACGILDYLSDEQALALLANARQLLRPGGHILVSNMAETRGADLLRRIYNWEILYRTPEEFGKLLVRAGFKNVRILVEPWGIHPVGIAQNL